MPGDFSILKYLPGSSGSRCGYCKSTDGYFNTGAWAYQLTTTDYQNLIDRGWRRSGMYCYKPTMEATCCPLYTIRCEAVNFKLTKSQKKILKRFHKFLVDGIVPKKTQSSEKNDIESTDDPGFREIPPEAIGISDSEKIMRIQVESVENSTNPDSTRQSPSSPLETKQMELSSSSTSIADFSETGSLGGRKSMSIESINRKIPRQGDGMDTLKPQCKKAKLLRLERKQKKLEACGLSPSTISKQPPNNQEKTLEDFLNEPLPENAAHTFQMTLVSCHNDPESFRESWILFVKYQMKVHGETEDEWDFESYLEFLVSPLESKKDQKLSKVPSYGSYHQQYYIDGKLFAVGVIDVLPYCVSSVYFFYDPDYMFLSLGTYGSLREVSLVRSLVKECPELKYYYLGYYIHSCPKMRYKGRMTPSFLLCPQAYTWHPLSDCLPKLEASKYSRLNPDPDATSPDSEIDIDKVIVLWSSTAMNYRTYSLRSQGKDKEEILQYAHSVGKKCAERIFLLRD